MFLQVSACFICVILMIMLPFLIYRFIISSFSLGEICLPKFVYRKKHTLIRDHPLLAFKVPNDNTRYTFVWYVLLFGYVIWLGTSLPFWILLGVKYLFFIFIFLKTNDLDQNFRIKKIKKKSTPYVRWSTHQSLNIVISRRRISKSVSVYFTMIYAHASCLLTFWTFQSSMLLAY